MLDIVEDDRLYIEGLENKDIIGWAYSALEQTGQVFFTPHFLANFDFKGLCDKDVLIWRVNFLAQCLGFELKILEYKTIEIARANGWLDDY